MLKKIKNFYINSKNLWQESFLGKCAIIFIILSIIIIYRILFADMNIFKSIQTYISNNKLKQELSTEQNFLKQKQHHIYLIQHYSSDFTEELAIKYLNMASPNVKILKLY